MFSTCVIYYFHVDSILVYNTSSKDKRNSFLEYVQYMCDLLFPCRSILVYNISCNDT
jgi:hypothetical protein